MKTRVALVVLLLLAAWPLAHRALVMTYDVNPWKLYGWAMYCVPPAGTEVIFLANPIGKEELTPHPIRFPFQVDGAAQALRVYKIKQAALGSLASAEHLAGILLKEYPFVGRVSIGTSTIGFDVETAMPVPETHWETYDRG